MESTGPDSRISDKMGSFWVSRMTGDSYNNIIKKSLEICIIILIFVGQIVAEAQEPNVNIGFFALIPFKESIPENSGSLRIPRIPPAYVAWRAWRETRILD